MQGTEDRIKHWHVFKLVYATEGVKGNRKETESPKRQETEK
jgi:hypothetical protein